jgi:manganese-dependent inorganic pyrophosphatase
MIKVFGHISPDTDATVSAIIWSWYLNAHTATEAEAFVLGQLNKETTFVLNTWKCDEPKLLETELTSADQVSIVDTNNPKELPESISHAEIIHIIDHHMLTGGLTSKKPIDIRIAPVASTATVLFDVMNISVNNLPDHIAGLILSSIISDTLAFRSPTTTPKDISLAEQLAQKLNITIDTYATQMFNAKSDISDFTDIGLVHLDSKKFDIGDLNIRISVVETTNPASVLARKDAIISAIKQVVGEESDTADVLFFIVDILKEESTVLTYNQLTKDIISASFGASTTDDTTVLPGVISRKKQIIPSLTLKK